MALLCGSWGFAVWACWFGPVALLWEHCRDRGSEDPSGQRSASRQNSVERPRRRHPVQEQNPGMGRWRRALLLVLPALLALQAQWRVSLPSQLPTPTLSQFQVLLLERPRESFAKRCTAMAVVRGGPVLLPPTAGRVLLRFPCDAALASGDGLMVSGGRWQRVSEGVTPLLTSPRERFARRGIHWQVRAERVAPVAVSISPALRLRRHLQQRFNQWVSPPADQLLTSLLMGRRQSDLPSQLLQGVAALGLSHVVAASGYHLSILLAAGLVLLGGMPRQHAARRRGWRLLLAGVAVGSLFLALAGAQASVVRALAMAAMALWARSRRRRARSLLVLWMVLLVMLLLRPRWGLDLGFQFSALATLGLLLGAPRLQNWLGRWLPDRLAAALAVPLAANLFTLPLQLSSAGVIPWLAIPANLLLLPWFALLWPSCPWVHCWPGPWPVCWSC
ncbi:MAG: hypothetical protein ERJ68_06485 [Aphanocapsa feldmannii 277cI]|uniref:ComEC/Rec2-related protein domain-containing protein n=2 Tax=Aphanocapsa feldmannii TaxID=192050 RepID=A0A524RSR9_9CHRO|nr:MAG: hypothetical protein ERJ68_06485 [Aphanocapsa feldmannii 277cI]